MRLLFCLMICFVSCTQPAGIAEPGAQAPQPLARSRSLDELRMAVTPGSSNLVAYHLTGAAWVEGQPVLVNRDFDFGIALQVAGAGPAIAAGNRKKANDGVAARLSHVSGAQTQALVPSAVEACGAECKNPHSVLEVAVYGLLYGGARDGAAVRLQTICEIYPKRAVEPMRLILVSRARPLNGENGWLEGDRVAVFEEMQSAIDVMASSATRLRLWLSEADGLEESRCPIGDGEKLVGALVDRMPGYSVSVAKGIPNTVVLCPP